MSYRSGSPATGPAGGAYFIDPLATPLPSGLGPPLPGQPFPPGSGNLAAPVVKPPVVTPPVAKSWVFAPNDNQQYEWVGTWSTPLTLPATPVKGSVVLSVDDASAGGSTVGVEVAVYDGTTWNDLPAPPNNWGAALNPPTFKWWCADRSYVDAAGFDPTDNTDTAYAWAESNGIHVLWSEGSRAAPVEQTFPYPTGVTMADMPASKTF